MVIVALHCIMVKMTVPIAEWPHLCYANPRVRVGSRLRIIFAVCLNFLNFTRRLKDSDLELMFIGTIGELFAIQLTLAPVSFGTIVVIGAVASNKLP